MWRILPPRNVEIADLDINPYLKEELEELNHLYQEIFNDNYPPESDFKDTISEYIFVNRVLTSAELFSERSGGAIHFCLWLPKMERKIAKSTMKEKTAAQIEFDEMVKELYQILKTLRI